MVHKQNTIKRSPIEIPILRKEAQKKEGNMKKILKRLMKIEMTGDYKSTGISLSELFPKFAT